MGTPRAPKSIQSHTPLVDPWYWTPTMVMSSACSLPLSNTSSNAVVIFADSNVCTPWSSSVSSTSSMTRSKCRSWIYIERWIAVSWSVVYEAGPSRAVAQSLV